jgi:hypothetical protein
LPVRVDARDLEPVETDRGYTIELSEARLVVTDLKFAIAGEEHAQNAWHRLADWLVPVAHAHPGHFVGGDVTGELLGHFITSWLPEDAAPLGVATLLEGNYRSASFAFGLATEDEGLSSDDPLLGHTAVLRGSATRGDVHREFLVVLDAGEEQELAGMPFDAGVRAGDPLAIGFELLPIDPIEHRSLFDEIDFARLPVEGELVRIESGASDPALAAAYERVSLAFHGASHFRMSGVPLEP